MFNDVVHDVDLSEGQPKVPLQYSIDGVPPFAKNENKSKWRRGGYDLCKRA